MSTSPQKAFCLFAIPSWPLLSSAPISSVVCSTLDQSAHSLSPASWTQNKSIPFIAHHTWEGQRALNNNNKKKHSHLPYINKCRVRFINYTNCGMLRTITETQNLQKGTAVLSVLCCTVGRRYCSIVSTVLHGGKKVL